MLQLLHPIWLLTGTAVIIPVILHLWNTRQGKTLYVGSILFMQQDARKSSVSIKLTQLLLLLCRCLLIMFVALLLSQPVWHNSSNSQTQKGWVLLEKEYSKATYRHFKPQIDSLLQAGYQLRYLQSDFSQTDTATLPAATTDSTRYNYWQLLPLLEQQVPANIPLYLFTGNQQGRFSGPRPAIQRPLHWYTYTPADSTAIWISNAWQTTGKTIRAIIAESHPSGNAYSYRDINTALQRDSFAISGQPGQWKISLLQQPPVAADTQTIHIALYAAGNQDDATYIQAAITALRNFTQLSIQLTTLKEPLNSNENYQWLIWLSAQPIPAQLKASRILQYDTGKIQVVNTAIQTGTTTEPLTLLQRNTVSPTALPSTVYWYDGTGTPLLYSNSNHYYFASRFNPAWNNLTWSPSFPVLLSQLLLPSATDNAATYADKRAIDTLQLQPAQDTTVQTAPHTPESTSLANGCWLLVFITLLAERMLAHKQKGGQPHAA